MRHQNFKEWIPLLAYDELDEDQKYLLDQHLAVCAECRATAGRDQGDPTGCRDQRLNRVTGCSSRLDENSNRLAAP